MVETEAVTRFKEHARTRLLMALRDAPEAGLEKEPAYEAIRREFEEEQGWPADLDEVEAGPARTPRWRNRLHWVVAELVQSGVLEPSGGSPLFRVTPLGRALLHLPQPFRDTPETRALIEALCTVTPGTARAGAPSALSSDKPVAFTVPRMRTMSGDAGSW